MCKLYLLSNFRAQLHHEENVHLHKTTCSIVKKWCKINHNQYRYVYTLCSTKMEIIPKRQYKDLKLQFHTNVHAKKDCSLGNPMGGGNFFKTPLDKHLHPPLSTKIIF